MSYVLNNQKILLVMPQFRYGLMLKLVVKLLGALRLVCLAKQFLKLWKTLLNWPKNQLGKAIKAPSSIESSKTSWFKEEISPTRMEQVVGASMVTDSLMRTSNWSIMVLAGYQWLMLEKILMAPSFSWQPRKPHGWMVVTSFLEKSSRAW